VPASPPTLAALRSLLAARFPERNRASTSHVITGVRAIDAALGGGLPAGRLTELVSATPSTGGQTVLAQLLRTTRAARERVALIDGADGFAPDAVPADAVRHLVWVRARNVAEAFAAADILVRDGNYAVVVLDLRGLADRALAKVPATTWHRLRHAAETSPSAVLIQTTSPLVPAVPWRLSLHHPVSLAGQRMPRDAIADALTVDLTRGHLEIEEKIA
jgi:hypothetical protein